TPVPRSPAPPPSPRAPLARRSWTRARAATRSPPTSPARRSSDPVPSENFLGERTMAEVLVLVEHADGAVKKVSTELITAARELGSPSAVVLGTAGTGEKLADA